jgi:hypothetical protein
MESGVGLVSAPGMHYAICMRSLSQRGGLNMGQLRRKYCSRVVQGLFCVGSTNTKCYLFHNTLKSFFHTIPTRILVYSNSAGILEQSIGAGNRLVYICPNFFSLDTTSKKL